MLNKKCWKYFLKRGIVKKVCKTKNIGYKKIFFFMKKISNGNTFNFEKQKMF